MSQIEHHTGPSQNTRAQKRKLEEILKEVPNHEFDDQLLCFELTMSLNSNEDVVKVMGASVLLVVQVEAFPKLAGLYKMEHKAWQDKKGWEEMLAMSEMRLREWEIERLRNNLIMLNRYYPWGSIVAAHPSRVLYSQHDPTRHHLVDAQTVQYSPWSPVDPIVEGSSRRLNFQLGNPEEIEDKLDMAWWEQNLIPIPEPTPPPDEKGKGVAGRPSKRRIFNKYGF